MGSKESGEWIFSWVFALFQGQNSKKTHRFSHSKKAQSNLRKHDVSFEEAVTVFKDTLALIFDDEEHSQDEQREIIIGFSKLSKLLLVCFVERRADVVRIISARKATRQEKADYEENARNQTA